MFIAYRHLSGLAASHKAYFTFLADRTIGRAFATACRLSVVCLSVCDVLYPGETVRLS